MLANLINIKNKHINIDNKNIIKKIISDVKVRRAIAYESHLWFFHIYFHRYATSKTANFQKEIFRITENDSNKLAVIMSFRNSAKSTIVATSYPIWAILGRQQKKFIWIISQTQEQAKIHFKNIKDELERNKILRNDSGPFKQEDTWRGGLISIPKYGAQILAASIEQKIRGIRQGEHRPDLIICDDIEDLDSIRTIEKRNRDHQWFRGDIIPAGDEKTKIMVVGNLLHEDSILMRLKKDIDEDRLNGICKKFPLIDEDNKCLWPERYNPEALKTLEKSIGDPIAWQREYLLRIVSDVNRVVWPEWIQYYDSIPLSDKDFLYAVTAIDPAISQKNSADYTAMVSARVYKKDDKLYIYILPNPVNERLTLPQGLEKAIYLSKSLGNGCPTRIVVEDVGYQRGFIQVLESVDMPVEAFGVEGQDKRSRIASTTHLIKFGSVLFPKKGAEKIIQQLVGFGLEKHDDLADAFTMVILDTMRQDLKTYKAEDFIVL